MSSSIHAESAIKSKDDMPPPRDHKGMRSVSPPLSNISFRKFNHYMVICTALLFAFYAWRLTVWKADAGGWWNLALGKKPPAFRDDNIAASVAGASIPATSGDNSRGDLTVEERINDLASALGMPSKDLASAIAGAVHDYVPPATMSSIASHQTG